MTIHYVATFRRDLKRLKRQGKSLATLSVMVDHIGAGLKPPAPCLDHALKGAWKGHRELHLESDWLLIYRIIDDAVYFVRTGSHAELFGL